MSYDKFCPFIFSNYDSMHQYKYQNSQQQMLAEHPDEIIQQIYDSPHQNQVKGTENYNMSEDSHQMQQINRATDDTIIDDMKQNIGSQQTLTNNGIVTFEISKIFQAIFIKNNEAITELKQKFVTPQQIQLSQPALQVNYLPVSDAQLSKKEGYKQANEHMIIKQKQIETAKIIREKQRIKKKLQQLLKEQEKPQDKALKLSIRMSYERRLRQLQIKSKQLSKKNSDIFPNPLLNSGIRTSIFPNPLLNSGIRTSIKSKLNAGKILSNIQSNKNYRLSSNNKVHQNQYSPELRYRSIDNNNYNQNDNQLRKSHRYDDVQADRSMQQKTKQRAVRSFGKIVKVNNKSNIASPQPSKTLQFPSLWFNQVQYDSNQIDRQLYRRQLPPLSLPQPASKYDVRKRQLKILQKSIKNNETYHLKKYIRSLLFDIFDEAVERIEQKRTFFSYRFARHRLSKKKKIAQGELKQFERQKQIYRLSQVIHPKNERSIQNSHNLHQMYKMMTSRILKPNKQSLDFTNKQEQEKKHEIISKWNKSRISPVFSYTINTNNVGEQANENNNDSNAESSDQSKSENDNNKSDQGHQSSKDSEKSKVSSEDRESQSQSEDQSDDSESKKQNQEDDDQKDQSQKSQEQVSKKDEKESSSQQQSSEVKNEQLTIQIDLKTRKQEQVGKQMQKNQKAKEGTSNKNKSATNNNKQITGNIKKQQLNAKDKTIKNTKIVLPLGPKSKK